MDLTIDQARDMIADGSLWPRVRDFLWDFASQVHKSWLEGLGFDDALAGLVSVPRAKAYILEALKVEPCFHVFPKEDWSRLVLLDGAMLLEIAKWLGAIACADELRKVTDAKRVRELKAALPGVYPAVFQYKAYFQGFDAKCAGGEIAGDRVLEVGFPCMAAFVDGLDENLKRRLSLKMPKSLSMISSSQDIKAKDSVLKKLLKLKFPEAYSLCC